MPRALAWRMMRRIARWGVLFGEVVAAEVVVVDVVAEHVPDSDEDGVLDGDDRLLFTRAGLQTDVARAEVGAVPGCGRGRGGGYRGRRRAMPCRRLPALRS